MIKLHARLGRRRDAEPFIARVARGGAGEPRDPGRDILFMERRGDFKPGYSAYLVTEGDNDSLDGPDTWPVPEAMDHLTDGDIVRISPRSGELWVMYRRASPTNAMLLTERCNSYCVMCSQPPKPGDDSYLVDAYLEAIPLMSPQTLEIGITGGEPTLLGGRLMELIRKCRECLPETGMHMLSNGRLFSYLSLCRELAAIDHPDLMIGIPLYSDIAYRHDFVVQADGAFDQTIRGIMNLARCGVSVEIRVVLHRQTVGRLPQLARFIARNLPFVDHVALMGLEMMGFVKMNLDALWVDPVDYRSELADAVECFQQHGLNVSIYNHQLCILEPQLWPVARKSISDWKNEYLDECNGCSVRDECGGFFASSKVRHSDHIRRIEPETLLVESRQTLSPSPTN